MPVVITVDAFPYRRFDGTVTHISPAARLKEKIKVFDIEVTLKEQIPDFRAGMTANIEVRGDKVEKALAVPVEGDLQEERPGGRLRAEEDLRRDPGRGEEAPQAQVGQARCLRRLAAVLRGERGEGRAWRASRGPRSWTGLEEGVEVALEDPTRPRQIEEED